MKKIVKLTLLITIVLLSSGCVGTLVDIRSNVNKNDIVEKSLKNFEIETKACDEVSNDEVNKKEKNKNVISKNTTTLEKQIDDEKKIWNTSETKKSSSDSL